RDVPRNSEQPVHDSAAPWIVGLGVAPRSHERLLGGVLSGAGLTQDGQRKSVHTPLEPPHECGRCLRISGSEPRQQCLVRDFHTHYYGAKALEGLLRTWSNLCAPPAP